MNPYFKKPCVIEKLELPWYYKINLSQTRSKLTKMAIPPKHPLRKFLKGCHLVFYTTVNLPYSFSNISSTRFPFKTSISRALKIFPTNFITKWLLKSLLESQKVRFSAHTGVGKYKIVYSNSIIHTISCVQRILTHIILYRNSRCYIHYNHLSIFLQGNCKIFYLS